MHNVYVPVIAIVVAFGIIFGSQAITESHLDDDVAALIAAQLDGVDQVELKDLKEVEKGYGMCGWYKPQGQDDYTPFYYSRVNERVTLDADSSRYRNHCGA
ncbi:hypothetical protein [Salinicola peritrichatus]|uniref:hypothetical protein n=1 Tax=Salinicola peritrichatus TaxID=1267424 RepID=UPI000DA1F405|nr:hypothetical protein [Salinicola peritrichatus]